MPSRKKKPATASTRARAAAKAEQASADRRAIAFGAERADKVTAERARRRRRQARSAAEHVMMRSAVRRRGPVPEIRANMLSALSGAVSAGTLVAEGDSWFDYPKGDILDMLREEHGFDIESVAHMGDRVEEMAFGNHAAQLHDFTERLEKLLRQGIVPRAILLSGGGNDIAGDEFEMLLNHHDSPIHGLNDNVVTGVIDVRIRTAYLSLISTVTGICLKYLTQPLPIITHGYAYPVPDGRGFLGGWWLLPGPWLEPGFNLKGFGNRAENVQVMVTLIDRFNVMMRGVAAQFPHVKFVDLRPLLSNAPNTYEDYWDNELHPTDDGFSMIAAQFAAAIG